jgi:hypothetical protein|nr:MAG TPA: hypothetical protein [Caudoviricetes sp.]
MISTKQINDLSRPANGWFHVEKSGDHDVDYGEGPAVLRIDEQAIRDMVDDFNARTFDGPGMLIDGDHLSHDLSRDTRALGWLKRLDTYRDPAGTLELYGFIEWTPRGLKMLQDKEYTQSSTEYGEGMTLTDGIYRPSRLTGFALTNRPRIKGKRPLVNRQTSPASVDEAGGDPKPQKPHEEGKTTQNTNMDKDDREYPSKEMDKAQRALFDSLLDKLDVEFDGTDDMSRAILGRLDELLSLEKREKDHVNAEVDDAVSTYENALDEEEREEFTEERREELKNSLRESPAALNAFIRALNRQAAPQKQEQPEQKKLPQRTPLNRRATLNPPDPFRKKESIEGFNNRVNELIKDGMKRYDAYQKATEEGFIVSAQR